MNVWFGYLSFVFIDGVAHIDCVDHIVQNMHNETKHCDQHQPR